MVGLGSSLLHRVVPCTRQAVLSAEDHSLQTCWAFHDISQCSEAELPGTHHCLAARSPGWLLQDHLVMEALGPFPPGFTAPPATLRSGRLVGSTRRREREVYLCRVEANQLVVLKGSCVWKLI